MGGGSSTIITPFLYFKKEQTARVGGFVLFFFNLKYTRLTINRNY
jgi:hypothetical protein